MTILSQSRYDMKIKAQIIEHINHGLEQLRDDLDYWLDRSNQLAISVAKFEIAHVHMLLAQFEEISDLAELDRGFNKIESRIVFHKMFEILDQYEESENV
jgi:hypothetical protein